VLAGRIVPSGVPIAAWGHVPVFLLPIERLRVGPVNGGGVKTVGESNDFFGTDFYFLCP